MASATLPADFRDPTPWWQRPIGAAADKLRELLTFGPSSLTIPTGLEEISREELQELVKRTQAFQHGKERPVLLNAPWSQVFDRELLSSKEAGPWLHYLRSSLKGRNLTELGVGMNADKHAALANRFLNPRFYVGVDQQSIARQNGAIISDVLDFVSGLPDASTNVLAFGLFNEPLSLQFGRDYGFHHPAKSPDTARRGHVEHEYIRRLTREIARVLPEGGVIFGRGLHSRGFEREIEGYFQLAGLVNDQKAMELGPPFHEMFYLRKPPR
jgi:hypothetical protein